MRLCIFEDPRVALLEPLTLTRPAFALWCGAETLLERQRRVLNAAEVGLWVRPALAELCRLLYPQLPVNDVGWLRENRVLFVNGRWLPERLPERDLAEPQVGLADGQPAFLTVPLGEVPPAPEELTAWLADWQESLPSRPAGGVLLDYLWDYVEYNGAALCRDEDWFRAQHGQRPLPPQVVVQGPPERLVIAEGAVVEPFVLVDTQRGPVLIDRGALVQSFSRLEGPCYVGRDSWVVGAKLRGGTIGPCCRVGGEVETSIVQGHSNKYHDGFLGHSYVGEWVNLAAGTQTSDLRNDYGTVRVVVNGQSMATGRTKVGAFIGDHTKTGLGALLNTGSVIGAFTNLLPEGSLLPRTVPSFCQVHFGQIQEQRDLRKILQTAATAMSRRGQELTEVHQEFYYQLYERTAEQRRRAVVDSEARQWRRSV